MVFKGELFLKNLLGLLSLLFFNFCSSDTETEYIRSVRNGEFKARIVVDSTSIYRSNRNNGQLSVDIKYKAVLLDTDIDSLEWLFPNGNPESEKETLSTTVNYASYGSFNSKLVLTRVDTVNLNYIYSYKDTIAISRPVEIVYKESNWDSFSTSNESIWAVLPNNENVIIREDEVFDESTPFEASASFTGFENNRLKFSVGYKLTHKNYIESNITPNTKLEVLIDDLKTFGVSRVSDDEYFTQEFYVNNLSDFDFIIKKYPSLTTSDWQLSLTASGTTIPDVELFDLVNQDKIIGYLSLEESSTSSVTVEVYEGLLKTSSNGNVFNFGISTGQNITIDGDPIEIEAGSNYKIIFTLEDGLPKFYQIIDENSSSVPMILDDNEYYLDASFKQLFISVDQ